MSNSKLFLKIILDFCTVMGSAGGIILLYSLLAKTVFRRWHLKNKIKKLTPSTTISYFIELLGSPAFINTNGDSKQYIFVDKLFYIDALTDTDNKVLAFSVTTRKSNFNPTLKLGPYSLDGKKIVIKLGKSKFSELYSLPGGGKINSSVGAHNFYYVEEYYFGNPGNYQSYAFSINQAGFTDAPLGKLIEISKEQSWDQEFRKNAVINTYTITEPLKNLADIGITMFPGVDYFQVRIMN